MEGYWRHDIDFDFESFLSYIVYHISNINFADCPNETQHRKRVQCQVEKQTDQRRDGKRKYEVH